MERWKLRLGAMAAGLVGGLCGGGGGLVLLPMLRWCGVEERSAFALCPALLWPVCAISAAVYCSHGALDAGTLLPCLLGGFVGGLTGGATMEKVPLRWLRRVFAVFLLVAGGRYLL